MSNTPEVQYRDFSDDIDFPDDYDPEKVDPRVRLRTNAIATMAKGKPTRKSMIQVAELTSAIANDAKDTASNLTNMYNDQIKGKVDPSEVIDARRPKGGNPFDTLGKRLDDSDQKLGALDSIEHGFDFATSDAEYMTGIEASYNVPFQGFGVEQNTKELYVGQATSEGDGYKTWILSRHKLDGRLLDSMTVTNGGHGVAFGLQYIDGEVYIWSNYRDYDETGTLTAQHLARFKYAPGASLTRADCEFFDNLPTRYPMPYVDQQNNILLVRQQAIKATVDNPNYTDELFNLYSLDGLESTTASPTPLYTLTVHQSDFESLGDKYTLQGYCSDGAIVYVYSGSINETMRIISYNASTGDQVGMRVIDFGKTDSLGGYPDDKVEAEGVAVYVDATTGQKALLVGLAVGRNPVNVMSQIYMIGQRNFLQVIQAQKYDDDQYSMTRTGGLAMTIANTVTKLSDVTTPGHYYIDKTSISNFSDFPQKVGDAAGWFFDVSAKVQGSTVMQTLTRNSPDRMIITQRMVQYGLGTIGSWAFIINEGTWSSVPFADGYSLYSGMGFVYRRTGYKHVEFRFQATKDDGSSFSINPTAETIATLPAEITPGVGYNFVGTANGGLTCRVNFGTKGNVTVTTRGDGVSWIACVGSFCLD